MKIKESKQFSILISNMQNGWWEETLRLFSAQSDATDIIKEALAASSTYTLSLAFECIEEGARVSADVRKQLFDAVDSALDSDDHVLAKLAARVKLLQRLRSFRRLNNTVEIDKSLITCAEYQLFLDHMLPAQSYYQPVHWKSFRFNKGEGRTAVRGIRGEMPQYSAGGLHNM